MNRHTLSITAPVSLSKQPSGTLIFTLQRIIGAISSGTNVVIFFVVVVVIIVTGGFQNRVLDDGADCSSKARIRRIYGGAVEGTVLG